MKTRTTTMITAAGLLLATLSGCSLFQKKPADVVQDPTYSSDTLPPVLGVASTEAKISARKLCSEGEVASLFAQVDPALASALKTRTYYFGTDSSELAGATAVSLDAHAAVLAKTAARVQLSGHTDERGTHDYNLALGERRANAVARYLVSHGVANDQLAVVSYGKEQPVADGHDEAAWAKNRRVEIEYTECKTAR